MIYMDAAASTLQKPREVADAVYHSLSSGLFGNPGRGSTPPALQSLKETYRLRKLICDTFGGETPEKIILTSGVTSSLNIVLQSLVRHKDHIISTVVEHNSVLRPLYHLEKQGAQLSFLPLLKDGTLNFNNLENFLQDNTNFLVITAASNVTGISTPLEALADFAQENNLVLIIDGAQGLGTIPQPLKNISKIIYCFTGHKGLYGPMGTGGIIIKGEYPFNQVFSGGSGYQSFLKEQPAELPGLFEPGTPPIPSLIGLKAGIQYIVKNKYPYEKLKKLTWEFYNGVKAIPGYTIYSPLLEPYAPIVSLNFKSMPSGELSSILWDKYEIVTRGGSHCAPLLHETMGTKEQGMVRFSFSEFNTIDEVHFTLEVLELIAKK